LVFFFGVFPRAASFKDDFNKANSNSRRDDWLSFISKMFSIILRICVRRGARTIRFSLHVTQQASWSVTTVVWHFCGATARQSRCCKF
jgi:hypothetical protein